MVRRWYNKIPWSNGKELETPRNDTTHDKCGQPDGQLSPSKVVTKLTSNKPTIDKHKSGQNEQIDKVVNNHCDSFLGLEKQV